MKITNQMNVYVKDLDYLTEEYSKATTDDRKLELIFMMSKVMNELSFEVKENL